ncbi:ATP-binding protein [Streptomyces sp. DT171]|uniref:ATP-binding protein n=1 Tax=Streptomyces sp. DT171 TaxID=3416524 RepID=UPI003CF94D6A
MFGKKTGPTVAAVEKDAERATHGASAVGVGPSPSVVVTAWPHSALSVGRARRLLAHHLEEWDLVHLADTAELVVSELVTNAVRHAGRPGGRLILTRFERVEGGVRIEVHDANDEEPSLRQVSPNEEAGRGLALVDAFTGGCWGVSDRDGLGKCVWAVCAENGPIWAVCAGDGARDVAV